jgi:hypothetical protein
MYVIRFANGLLYGSDGQLERAEVYPTRTSAMNVIVHFQRYYKVWTERNGHTGLLKRWKQAVPVACKLILEEELGTNETIPENS